MNSKNLRAFFSILVCVSWGFICIEGYSKNSNGISDDSLHLKVNEWLKVNSKSYEWLKLAGEKIGHRLTGTLNGRSAESFVYEKLVDSGLDSVAYDPFPIQVWNRKICKVELVPFRSDNYLKINAVSLANTPSATGLWHIVDGGDGLEKDLQRIKEKIKGNCLLLNLELTKKDSGRRNLHRAEKISLALKYGASSVIFIHPAKKDNILTGTASLSGKVVDIPAVCISGNEGQMLRDWLKTEKVMADFLVKNEQRTGEARNVLGYIKAKNPTKETIVFTAHLDSWDLSTGATDNGLGSFALLDIARAVNQYRSHLNRNVLFIWTMGEELGLLGSRHILQTMKNNDQLKDIKLLVNLDMVGNPVGFNAFDWPGLGNILQDFGTKAMKIMPGFKNTLINEPDLHSDHQPFMLEGVPVFSAISSMPDSIYDCYHADCDNINLIQPHYLTTSATLHSMLALELGRANRIPVRHFGQKKLSNWLTRHGLKEKLQISNEWKWK